ncbi:MULTISPECIES: PLP-dependent aminotransferase family protein [unclassified Phyllobacterium]|uniref:aminotransferase-like domain-containing protein n=1 Tax=unclassified Phyllobacterium TaxID=2638441 RepID=UPI00056C4577|nr:MULTISPECIES: PLP-dependent aminotransferase family protein [unclassified Phyllobacterium]SFI76649.1 DNA-binding transcriptional regulator, MocR family, contains an aminotransferase domain [Phyllobacterium sp. CL33Tsu]
MAWKPRIAVDARYKHQGLADALRADIASGAVKSGDALPPQREIARELGVDLTTVTRALNEVRRSGHIEGRIGSGTFVKAPAVQAAVATQANELDLTMNIPPQPADLPARIANGIGALLANGQNRLLSYQETAGSASSRAAAACWLAPRLGAAPEKDRLVVAGGAQSALFAVCNLLGPGTTIAAGAATYPGLKSAASSLGLKLYPLAMDEAGITPESFEECCRNEPPKALYIISSIDNPTTATMPLARRRAIAAIAARHGVAVIEDDPYAELLDKPIPALATLAPDLTWHIATLSKCVAPALRIAFVACPSALDALKLGSSLRASNPGPSPLLTALAADFIQTGTLREIATTIRSESRERQALAARILKDWTFRAEPGGHHLWLSLPQQWHAGEFAALAIRSGLGVVPASAFSIGAPSMEAVRVSLGAAPDRTRLEQGLVLLDRLLREPKFSPGMIV